MFATGEFAAYLIYGPQTAALQQRRDTMTHNNLGKALSIWAEASVATEMIDYDLLAFHAPSECWPIAHGRDVKRTRLAARRACHMAGVRNLRILYKLAKKRGFNNRAELRLHDEIRSRHYPHIS